MKKYLFAFLILFVLEIIIATFINDAIIRPFIGDVLVVILMYTLIRGFMKKPIQYLPLYLFLFATAVEIAQYFNIVKILDLHDNKLIATIIGTTFDIKDIICYLAATIILLIWEEIEKKKLFLSM